MFVICGILLLVAASSLGQQPDCLRLPSSKDPTECCNWEKLVEDAVFRDCVDKFGPGMNKISEPFANRPTERPNSIPTGCCVSECLLNATGILKNSQIEETSTVQNLAGKVSNDPELVAVIKEAVGSCIALVQVKSYEFAEITKLPPPPNGMRICNPMSGFFIGCLHSHMFRNCPIKRWTKSQECDILKEHFNKCPLPFPVKAN